MSDGSGNGPRRSGSNPPALRNGTFWLESLLLSTRRGLRPEGKGAHRTRPAFPHNARSWAARSLAHTVRRAT
eukprot:4395730-Alexandrium_andersonii.AAC.1